MLAATQAAKRQPNRTHQVKDARVALVHQVVIGRQGRQPALQLHLGVPRALQGGGQVRRQRPAGRASAEEAR